MLTQALIFMTITLKSQTIRVGLDFVDAETGTIKSKGIMEVSKGGRVLQTYAWRSTQPINETEKALRASADKEGVRITRFTSQAV